MVIGKATADDIEAILALQTQIYRVVKKEEGAEAALKAQLADETCDILVAKENDKTVGTITIYFIEVAVRARPYALFEGLVVDKSARGRGIGTKLFQKSTEVARQKNCYKIIFTSGSDRPDAHKFYEKLGFKKWGFEFRMDL